MWGILESLGLVRTMTAILGGVILIIGLRAYRATRRKSILLFAAGMGSASVGYLLEGVLVQAAGWSLMEASLLESLVSLAAFALLAASLWVRDSTHVKVGREPLGTHPTAR